MKITKLSIFTLALLLATGLILAVPVMAQEITDVASDENVTAADLGVSEPSTGFFGFLKNVANGVQYAFTFNPVKKAELKLEKTSEILLKAQNVLENNPDSIKALEKYNKFLEKYDKTITQVQEKIQTIKEKAEENPKVDQLLNRLTDNTFKQQRLMDNVNNLLDEDQKAKLQENREHSLKTMGEALKKLETNDKLSERLENAINNQAGSHLINLKNLEVLEGLKNQVPEEALKGIKNAQTKTLDRLDEALQNYAPEARREKFQTYMENSNSDPLTQFEVLDALEQIPTLFKDIKIDFSTIKDDKIEKIDYLIETYKNDEHKIMNLERIRDMEDPKVKNMLRQIENKYVNPEAPVGEALKVDYLKEIFRKNLPQNEKPELIENRVEGRLDKIENTINTNYPEPTIRMQDPVDSIKDAVLIEEKPIMTQEQIKNSLDKINNQNQERVETQNQQLNQQNRENDSIN